MALAPKMRRARDVGSECSCPPGMCLLSQYMNLTCKVRALSQVLTPVHTRVAAPETSACDAPESVCVYFVLGADNPQTHGGPVL